MNLLKAIFSFVALILLFSCSDEISQSVENQNESFFLKKITTQWNDEDFFQVKSYQIGNLKKIENLSSFKLEEGLLIEPISEEEYEKANKNKYRHYLKDTLSLIKINNSIKIGKTVLSDKFVQDKNRESYSYLGYFPILNQYLIQGGYLESFDYKVIDKDSGEIKQSFVSYPIISKNGNFVTICKTNKSQGETYFEIYNYSNGFYKNAFKAIFTKWSVVDFEKFAFWGNDGSFYLKIDRMNKETENGEVFVKMNLN